MAFCLTVMFISHNIQVSVSTSGIFWIMANQNGAIIAMVIILLGMLEWLKYVLRIYNRFKFTRETEDMRFVGKLHQHCAQVYCYDALEHCYAQGAVAIWSII